MSGTLFSKVNKHTVNDPRGPIKYDYAMMKYGTTLNRRHTGTLTPAVVSYIKLKKGYPSGNKA